ncbi:uncharacterized protein [Antedon mediterranea]|uniref:uncharacterized protein n=1 Tax=Antedon mediterranea TaxID=105859 RepID=UPI003AF80C74
MQRAKVKNEIVLMRKLVKRVKVQVIRQMSRQVKQLRGKKGTEQQIGKNLRRVERLLEELECIKDLVADDISRQAFFGKLSFDIQSQEDDALKRATTKIVQHKIIQERVKSLREQGILTSNLNLKELDRKKRRKKKPTHLDLGIEKSNVESMDIKDDTNVKDDSKESGSDDNNDDDQGDHSDSSNDDTNDSDVSEDATNDQAILRQQKSQLKRTLDKSVEGSKASDFFIRGSSDDNSDIEKDDSKSDAVLPQPSSSKINRKTVKKNRQGENRLKGMRGRREQLEENTRSAFKKRAAEAKAAIVDRPNSTTTPMNTEKNILGISELPPDLETKDFSIKEGMNRFVKQNSSSSPMSGQRTMSGQKTMSNRKPQKNLPVEKLHPSWEAKRKQKEQSAKILPFQGKKITFDD